MDVVKIVIPKKYLHSFLEIDKIVSDVSSRFDIEEDEIKIEW